MTTCEELKDLLTKKELENTKYELKSSKLIGSKNWKIKLAIQFVAFANLNGGKLIIGIQDNGEFDGKANYDIDELKGDIENIIHTKTSPIVKYNFEFLECEQGDLSIFTINKKKNVPSAIIKREGGEIKNRTYYIRTSHGKRLVSDHQLKFLFNEKKLSLFHPFSIVLVFNRPSFLITDEFRLAPEVQFDFAIEYNKIYQKYKNNEGKFPGRVDDAIIELLNS